MRPGRCAICHRQTNWLEVDHIVPRSLGGSDVPSNRQLLCGDCHKDKTSRERRLYPLGRRARIRRRFAAAPRPHRHSAARGCLTLALLLLVLAVLATVAR